MCPQVSIYIYARTYARMEVHEFEMCIDGVVLPRRLFDPGSQVNVQTWLEFAGRVERCAEDDDDNAFYAAGAAPFAELDGTQLCFFVTAGRNNSVCVKSHEGDVRIACDGESAAMEDSWWQLAWDDVYTVSSAPDRAMTLRVRKIRPPLRDIMRGVLDGMNRPGEPVSPRAAGSRGRENRP